MNGGPRLGFGCASLGSRIAPGEGLAALDRAYDAGVRWFDVAPSYGDGEAELLLGQFLRHRPDAIVCTKVGVLPPAPSLSRRIARPAVRTLLRIAPGLRAAVKTRRPSATKPPLTAGMIADSIHASLRRLGREQVEVLALHEATSDEVVREDILRALEELLKAGKAARLCIASSVAAARAGLASSAIYSVVQLANNPMTPNLRLLAPALAVGRAVETVTHTVFGADGMVETFADRIAGRPALADAFSRAGYAGPPRAVALAFLPDYAFASNADGTVLLSMFSRRHLEANLSSHAAPRKTARILELAELLAGSQADGPDGQRARS